MKLAETLLQLCVSPDSFYHRLESEEETLYLKVGPNNSAVSGAGIGGQRLVRLVWNPPPLISTLLSEGPPCLKIAYEVKTSLC